MAFAEDPKGKGFDEKKSLNAIKIHNYQYAKDFYPKLFNSIPLRSLATPPLAAPCF